MSAVFGELVLMVPVFFWVSLLLDPCHLGVQRHVSWEDSCRSSIETYSSGNSTLYPSTRDG